jgi:hypothetical protein
MRLSRLTALLPLMLCALSAHAVSTRTFILSDSPNASAPRQDYQVRVRVEEDNVGAASVVGQVQVSDDAGVRCNITLTGSIGEVGVCTLRSFAAGERTLTANFVGGGGFDPSSDTQAHQVRQLAIAQAQPSRPTLGEGVVFMVSLDLTPIDAPLQPTGSVTVSDGADACVIALSTRPPLRVDAEQRRGQAVQGELCGR